MRYLELIAVATSVLAASAAAAQERPGTAQATPLQSRSWAKLCDTPTAPGKGASGKPGATGAKACLIHHELLDSTSGAPLVSVAVWQTGKRQTFTVMVPAGVNQAAGTKVDIFPSGLWEKMLRRESLRKQEAGRLRTLKLNFASCDAERCTAEAEASLALIADLRSKGGFTVMVIKGAQAFAFPITLNGFRAAYDGPPIDSARYLAARSALLRELRERQKRREPSPQRRDQQI